MTEPRLSTVFDYSDLRLHPNGTRVYQKTSNRRPVIAKVTVQDARANWIAKDAGGSARVAKYRKRAPKDGPGDSDAEEIDISRELDDEAGKGEEKLSGEEDVVQSGEEGSQTSSKKRAGKKLPDQRKFKRRKFEANDEYLAANEPRTKNVETDGLSEVQSTDNTFPTVPSPDLLKVIHRYASEFYTERGQLLNISREYRKERKKRALERKAKPLNGGSSRAAKKKVAPSRSQSLSHSESDVNYSEQDSDDLSEGESESRRKRKGKGKEMRRDNETRRLSMDRDQNEDEDEEAGEFEEDEDGVESASDINVKKSTKSKRRRKPGKEKILPQLYTDMYKVFDGSAMMALGLLVQEHIASLLNPEVPESWNKEMKRVYGEDASSGDEEEEDELLEGEEEGIEGEGEDAEDEVDAEDAEGEEEKHEDEKGEEDEEDELDDSDEEDELIDEVGENGHQDEGVDKENNPSQRDDTFEHGNKNEHHVNPYVAASSRAQTNNVHADSKTFTSGEPTTGHGLEDADDPIEWTSDESLRSEDTMHSDSENEFI